MHLESDEILQACDALADTMVAARAALEALAASELSFSAQVRVQRLSTELARAWVQQHVDLDPLPSIPPDPSTFSPRDDATDEILERALGESLSSPASPVDPSDGEPIAAHEPASDLDPLGGLELSDEISFEEVSFDDDFIGVDFTDDDLDEILSPTSKQADVEAGDQDESPPGADPASDQEALISYEDSDQADEANEAEPTYEIDDPSSNDLVSFVQDDSLVSIGDDEPLIQFDDAEEPTLVDLGVEEFTSSNEEFEDPDSIATPVPSGPRSAKGSGEPTLVADLDSLVQLQDILTEDEQNTGATAGSGAEDPVLSEEDLGRLGFGSDKDLLSPEGTDADPASDTGSGAIVIPEEIDSVSDEPSPLGARVSVARSRATTTSGTGGAVAIPTIRDQRHDGPSARPAAAAIRINPDGESASAVLQEPETLELGAADEDDLDEHSISGFSLSVEEYEAYDDDEFEDLEAEEELDEVEPEAPAPLPSLSSKELQELLAKAQKAVDQADIHRAIELFSEALDFDPDHAPAYVGRGLAWLELSDYGRAMSDFTNAEDLTPDNAEVNAAFGKLYYDRKEYGRAIEYLDLAIKQNPKHPMAWCRRGISHYYRKDYPKAHDDLNRAEKLDPEIPNIRTYISMVRKRMK